jgi:hypothetical protein
MPDEEKSKIIIDEDWKARVEREKEEARKVAEEQAAHEPTPEEKATIQPASFEGLVSNLAMQAMISLGVLVPRDTKEVMVDLAEAKYLIDTIIMLRDKTKGNLSPEEQGFIAETLADLQQTFVLRSQQLQEAALRNAGVNLNPQE